MSDAKLEAVGKFIFCGIHFLSHGLSHSSILSQEEIFVPVVCPYLFDIEQEAVSKANDSDYGLSATILTSNQEKARIARYFHSRYNFNTFKCDLT